MRFLLVIAAIYVLIQIRHDRLNIERCEKSQYKTNDYEIINNKLACQDSGKRMQILTVMELYEINRRINSEN